MTIWKDIPGYKGLYEVSDTGLIRNWKTWKILKPRPSKKDGGMLVNLYGGANEEPYKTMAVHRIVAEAFLPNPEDRHIVKHKDGDKTNNLPNNLYWATSKRGRNPRIKVAMIGCPYRNRRTHKIYYVSGVNEDTGIVEYMSHSMGKRKIPWQQPFDTFKENFVAVKL